MEKEMLLKVIAAAQAGDPEAQSRLIEEVQKPVYYQCLKILKNESDAQDAAQETLIALLTKLDTLKEPEAFWGWMNRTAVYQCKMMLRKTKELQIPEDEEGNSLLDSFENLDEQIVPDKALDNGETQRMILELIDALPTPQRMCVIMYYYDEMKTREISEVLEVSESTVKSRLNYARKSIAEGVKGYEKQGIKLYGLSPLPLLLFFLRRDAERFILAPELAHTLEKTALAAANGGVIHAGDAVAASVQGGSDAAGAAGKAAATAAAKTVGHGIATKVVAGALAAIVLLGGGGVLLSRQSDSTPEINIPSHEQSETGSAETGQSTGMPAGTGHSEVQDCLWLLDAFNVRYARLLDMDADGVEDMLFCAQTDDGTVFLYAVPTTTTHALEDMVNITPVIGDGSEPWGLYQNDETGICYVGSFWKWNPEYDYHYDFRSLSEWVSLSVLGSSEGPRYSYQVTTPGYVGDIPDNVISQEEYTARAAHFKLIEMLPVNRQTTDFSSFANTVDEVRQQLNQ